jgi:hypothetical protein
MTRAGTRGPRPKRCEEHTAARKRAISHHPVKPKAGRYECCEPDQLCFQHEQQRDEFREQAAKELARHSASLIFGILDAELEETGFQIVLPEDPSLASAAPPGLNITGLVFSAHRANVTWNGGRTRKSSTFG